MVTFLNHLINQLDLETPNWRDNTCILLDGARYHTGTKLRKYMRKMQLDIMWSAPYSYSTAPIELLFGALKFGELNPGNQSTGKKALHLIGDMEGHKLRQIPRSTLVRFWHKTTLNLFNYLYYERI